MESNKAKWITVSEGFDYNELLSHKCDEAITPEEKEAHRKQFSKLFIEKAKQIAKQLNDK